MDDEKRHIDRLLEETLELSKIQATYAEQKRKIEELKSGDFELTPDIFKTSFIILYQISKKAISKSSKRAIASLVYMCHNTDLKSLLQDNPLSNAVRRMNKKPHKENDNTQSTFSFSLLSYFKDNSTNIKKTVLVSAGVLVFGAVGTYVGAGINLANRIKELDPAYSKPIAFDATVKYYIDGNIKLASDAILEIKKSKDKPQTIDLMVDDIKIKFHQRYEYFSNISINNSIRGLYGIQSNYQRIDKTVTDALIDPPNQ